MKEIIFIFFMFSVLNCWGQTSAEQKNGKESACVNVTRINLTVNLLDKECIKKSGYNASFVDEDKNSVEVQDVDMDTYALCLLKKSSIMNDDGKVNVNFDIVKIVTHLYKKTDKLGLGLAFIIKSLEKCRYLNGSNQFYTASKIMKCLIDNQETILWCN